MCLLREPIEASVLVWLHGNVYTILINFAQNARAAWQTWWYSPGHSGVRWQCYRSPPGDCQLGPTPVACRTQRPVSHEPLRQERKQDFVVVQRKCLHFAFGFDSHTTGGCRDMQSQTGETASAM